MYQHSHPSHMHPKQNEILFYILKYLNFGCFPNQFLQDIPFILPKEYLCISIINRDHQESFWRKILQFGVLTCTMRKFYHKEHLMSKNLIVYRFCNPSSWCIIMRGSIFTVWILMVSIESGFLQKLSSTVDFLPFHSS